MPMETRTLFGAVRLLIWDGDKADAISAMIVRTCARAPSGMYGIEMSITV